MNQVTPQDVLEATGQKLGSMRAELDQDLTSIEKRLAENSGELADLVGLVETQRANVEDNKKALLDRLEEKFTGLHNQFNELSEKALAIFASAASATDLEDVKELAAKSLSAFDTVASSIATINTGLEVIAAELEEIRSAPAPTVVKGDPGEPGRDGLSLVLCGTWDDGLEYRAGDIVTWDGASWGCGQATAVGEAPGTIDKWQILASRGKRGKPGEIGAKSTEPGPRGLQGTRGPAIVGAKLMGRSVVLTDEDGKEIPFSLEPLMIELAATFDNRMRDIEQAIGLA